MAYTTCRFESPVEVTVVQSFGEFVEGQKVFVDRVAGRNQMVGVKGMTQFIPATSIDSASQAEVKRRFDSQTS